MKPELLQLMNKVHQLLEGEEISLLLEDIKLDIANQMIKTKPNENEKRNELYFMSYGVSLLERKMNELSNLVITGE